MDRQTKILTYRKTDEDRLTDGRTESAEQRKGERRTKAACVE